MPYPSALFKNLYLSLPCYHAAMTNNSNIGSMLEFSSIHLLYKVQQQAGLPGSKLFPNSLLPGSLMWRSGNTFLSWKNKSAFSSRVFQQVWNNLSEEGSLCIHELG